MTDNPHDPSVAGTQLARANIDALKVALRKEKAAIVDYRDRLVTGRGNFPAAGLLHGIERCEHNIAVLKGAMLKERANIKEMREQSQKREEMRKLFDEGIQVETEYDEGSSGGGDEDGDEGDGGAPPWLN